MRLTKDKPNSKPTHFAFSDDSKHSEGRYNSLCVVTLGAVEFEPLNSELEKLLSDSGIKSEFKWSKLGGAQYRFAAEKMIDFVLRNIDQLRLDVLIWDINDSRHKNLIGRDDTENLVRMYYHLIATTCSKKWPMEAVRWMWYPDEQSSVDWSTLRTFICSKKYRRGHDLFSTNSKFEMVDLSVEPARSHQHSFIQLADLFAGLAAYSWGNFAQYNLWIEQQKESGLFTQKNVIKFSNSENERFPILHNFKESCTAKGMKISLESSSGLFSHRPMNRINFWFYRPQHSLDKAPTRTGIR